MSRTVKIVIAVVIVLAIAGGLGAWYLFGEDTPAKLSLSDDTKASGRTVSVAGTWKVKTPSGDSEDTVAGYRVNEKFSGGVATKTAAGRTSDVSGTVIVAGRTIRSGHVRVILTNLHSSRAQRDAAIHTRGLETDKYPNATFDLIKQVRLPEVRSGKVFRVKVTGRLSLHDVARTVTTDLKLKGTSSKFQVQGSIPIKMKDYKIDPPNVPGFVTVEDHGTLEIKILLGKT